LTNPGEITERHRFDSERLAVYLGRHLPAFRGPLTVKQFHGGQSNPTYLLQTEAADYVLRSKPAPAANAKITHGDTPSSGGPAESPAEP